MLLAYSRIYCGDLFVKITQMGVNPELSEPSAMGSVSAVLLYSIAPSNSSMLIELGKISYTIVLSSAMLFEEIDASLSSVLFLMTSL